MNFLKSQFAIGAKALAAIVFMAAGGCASFRDHQVELGRGCEPENVFSAAPVLPAEVRRVAVLPLTAQGASAETETGGSMLEPVLAAELSKTAKFEVVAISPEDLRVWTGRESWSDADVLPRNFFETLRKASGCDAVLFCRLTAFRAYPPLAVGWRLRLVEARTQETIWAGDEVFDAGNPGVKAGAARYGWSNRNFDDEHWLMANSPRSFGQYSVAKLFETLPKR